MIVLGNGVQEAATLFIHAALPFPHICTKTSLHEILSEPCPETALAPQRKSSLAITNDNFPPACPLPMRNALPPERTMLDSSEYPVSHLLKALAAQHLKSNDLNATETLGFPIEELGWQWTYSPETCRDHSPTDIAGQLSRESSSKMTEIPFAAWVKRAMGRESPFYELFRRQHYALRDRIKEHITACQDLDTYYKVKRVSQPRHRSYVFINNKAGRP